MNGYNRRLVLIWAIIFVVVGLTLVLTAWLVVPPEVKLIAGTLFIGVGWLISKVVP